MLGRINNWKKQIASQHASAHTQTAPAVAYAETVLSQAESFFNVGQFSVAEALLNRLDAWAKRRGTLLEVAQKKEPYAPFSQTFDISFVKKEFENLSRFFVEKQQYIPKPEKESIAKSLADVERLIVEKPHEESAKIQLHAIKKRLFDRLHRSLRAQFSASAFMRPFVKVDNQIGPYNNAHNLSEVCKIISERDAIWIDDLIQLYGSLFKLEDKITQKKFI